MLFHRASNAMDCQRKGTIRLGVFLLLLQLAVSAVTGVFFYTRFRNQNKAQPAARRESSRETENLCKMRAVSLSEPLAGHVRPRELKDIIGQEEGIHSLMVILCGKNPQHVLIYGPPGVRGVPQPKPGAACPRKSRPLCRPG